MLPAPSAKHLERLLPRLFPGDTARAEALRAALAGGNSSRPAVIWTRPRPSIPPFAGARLADWQPAFVDAVPAGVKAGKLPEHEAGSYYGLDFSSVVSASVLLAVSRRVGTVVDLCAAPGGKGIFSWRLLRPDLLVANEVIGKRSGALIGNLRRCGVEPSEVTRKDPAVLAAERPECADLVIVDAPCSGQSLVAKGMDVPGAFNPKVVKMNAARQRRILGHAAALAAPGGYLAYMTCTYSPEENEDAVAWLLARRPDFEAVRVDHLGDRQSGLAPFPCYRHWPFEGQGVGGFTCLLRRANA